RTGSTSTCRGSSRSSRSPSSSPRPRRRRSRRGSRLIAQPASSSPSVDLRAATLAAAVAASLFFASWGVLHYGFYTRSRIPDTPIYERYGDLMRDGRLPYRDFGVEYPPGALPAFVLP